MQSGNIFIIVQENGAYSVDFDEFRDLFIARNGSDSVFLNCDGEFLERAINYKNGAQNMGIGFRGKINYDQQTIVLFFFSRNNML